MSTAPKFIQLIEALHDARVELVIVGGVAAVAHGAPVSTFDLDIVHRRTPENIERLVTCLRDLDAVYRGRGKQRLGPERHHLDGAGHNLLQTKWGPLDVLGSIIGDRDYDTLLPHSELRDIGRARVHVLGLVALIEIKEALGRDKDKAMLAILRHTLAEKK
ncbi:MAG: hypothetical protein IT381_27150 [Deltaproteobacteria bacterium]|nr:hypothetical protein [Deltaproteobacteria bacterium]